MSKFNNPCRGNFENTSFFYNWMMGWLWNLKKSLYAYSPFKIEYSPILNIGLDYLWRSYGWSKSTDHFLVILMWKTPIPLGGVKIISGLLIYLPEFFRVAPKISYWPYQYFIFLPTIPTEYHLMCNYLPIALHITSHIYDIVHNFF